MENVIQTILQSLPFGDWLAQNPFGTVYGTYLLNALTCILLLLSKPVFKKYFLSPLRKKFFLSFVAGTSLLISACFVFVTVSIVPVFYTFDPVDFSYLLPIFHGLSLIAYLFFLVYLVDFVISLVRLRRQKSEESRAE